MEASDTSTLTGLAGLDWSAWREALHDAAGEEGFAEWLGPTHAAMFQERKPILLVSFETFQSIQSDPNPGAPMLTPLVQTLGWSHMALVSLGDTWFRDRNVIGFFDRLVDDGFFEDFEQVIFYGAGAAGYAACAFSVSAPGAKVLAIQPQATLDPRIAEWDDRFLHMRRTDFTSRFGYAPDMLDAAQQAWVFYNPENQLDAMHASLFERSNVTRMRARFFGKNLETSFTRMPILFRLLALLSADKLTLARAGKVLRQRRENRDYLLTLLSELEWRERYTLMLWVCDSLASRFNGPRFRKIRHRAAAALNAPPKPSAQD